MCSISCSFSAASLGRLQWRHKASRLFQCARASLWQHAVEQEGVACDRLLCCSRASTAICIAAGMTKCQALAGHVNAPASTAGSASWGRGHVAHCSCGLRQQASTAICTAASREAAPRPGRSCGCASIHGGPHTFRAGGGCALQLGAQQQARHGLRIASQLNRRRRGGAARPSFAAQAAATRPCRQRRWHQCSCGRAGSCPEQGRRLVWAWRTCVAQQARDGHPAAPASLVDLFPAGLVCCPCAPPGSSLDHGTRCPALRLCRCSPARPERFQGHHPCLGSSASQQLSCEPQGMPSAAAWKGL